MKKDYIDDADDTINFNNNKICKECGCVETTINFTGLCLECRVDYYNSECFNDDFD